MFKYDVSIVIAVYNNEKYLKKCIKSVLNQTYDVKKIQLILVNDGSTDKSLEICREYEKNNENILVIDKENGGASSARNEGIKNAEGKYIMILDSDDTISKNSVEDLLRFFNSNYDEIDLLTYRMLNVKNNKKTDTFRKVFFDKGEGIYDLEENPYISQSGINIMIKNKQKDNYLYDCSMEYAEDEKFNTKILMKKRKIGYCNSAEYLYNRNNPVSVTNNRQNPYYCFKSVIKYYQDLVKEYSENNSSIPKYIQGLILNCVRWRIYSDELYPYFYDEKDFNKAVESVNDLIAKIDTNVILKHPTMDIYHKLYLLKIKNEDFNINVNTDGTYSISCQNESYIKDSKISIVFTRMKVRKNIVKCMGYLETPLFEVIGKSPDFYMRYQDDSENEKEQKIECFESVESYHKSRIKTNKLYGFDFEIDLSKINKFLFFVKLNDKEIKTLVKFLKWCPFRKKIKKYKVELDKKFFIYNGYKHKGKKYQFFTKEENLFDKIKFELGNLKRYKSIRMMLLRFLSKRKNKIWLYSDVKDNIDNAFYQFENDIKIKDSIKKYYVYDGNKKTYSKALLKNEKKYLIKFGSIRHKILYLKSDKILSSHATIHEYCPLNEKELDCYCDILKYDLIYLQHGILHANLRKLYSKEFTEVEKIVVSSNFEKNNYIEKYNYNESNIIATGMPRLSKDKEEIKVENKILLAPSWRNYLIGESIERRRQLKVNTFLNSKYYNEINDFLNSDRLIKILKENNLKLDFQIHPIFKDYSDLFNVNNEFVNVVNNTNIKKYKILITDFSSFQFDFVIKRRPIIYFVPDIKEFKAGLHTYRELDLPYEEAFGKLTVTQSELINKLEEIINNNFTDDEKYLNREKEFFIDFSNSQQKLYNELIKE